MARKGLSTEAALDVHLSAICTRNQYARDAAPVISELRKIAGDRTDVLARVAGVVAGYYDGVHTRALCAALRDEIEGAEEWVELGRARRGAGAHGTDGFVRLEPVRVL